MIDSVRSTVLAILSKNNFGYIGVQDFNLYAKQAQMDIFTDLFSQYNKLINLENVRQSGTDYANQSKIIAEAIEVFSVTNFLTKSSNNIFYLPSLSTTGDDYFMINKVVCYPIELVTGTNTSVVASQLVSTSSNFTTSEVAVNDIVVNVATGVSARVLSVVSSTVLSLSADIFPLSPTVFQILDASKPRIAEKVSQSKITELSISLLTTPNNLFPVYSQEGNLITLLPNTLDDYGKVQAQYFKYPLDPKWTYISLSGGEPIFDQSQSDYQDIELPLDYEVSLITKILKYCGLEIREQQVEQFAQLEEQKENAK